MVVSCKSDTIKVGGFEANVEKETVAIYVVAFDLLICFYFWISLLVLIPF